MGVHGLWELLAPVGRRVSVETLAGKRLAIDASIWMVQFMKAMRDEKGEMVRNAHILGFFRRICKLLFLRTKPVFVFDGGTPALKRRTVIARRRQRENAQAKIRKTAEKLLLNHLKTMRLQELAEGLKNQRQNNDIKGKNVVLENSEVLNVSLKANEKVNEGYDQKALDELLAASIAAEEDGSFTTNLSASVSGVAIDEEDDEDEEMILPTMHGRVDPSVLASLPPSLQLDLLVQMREGLMAENRQKYQKVKKAPAKFSELQIQSYLKTVAFRREIDEVQKAAAGRGVGGVQTSRIASEANREFIFSSSFTGDKETLASAGVKRHGGVEGQPVRKDPVASDLTNHVSSITEKRSATASEDNVLGSDFDDGVERYLDDRGRLRVSRVRAMGIRMTRDLQRNLDLMKEIEQDKMKDQNSSNLEAFFSERIDGIPNFGENNHLRETSDEMCSVDGTDDSLVIQGRNLKKDEQSILESGPSIEISFIEDENKCEDRDYEDVDDDLFAQLVAGNSALLSSAETASSGDPSHASVLDFTWKGSVDEEKGDMYGKDSMAETGPSLAKGNSDESDVDWEEGDLDVPTDAYPSPCKPDTVVVSRGSLEEYANIEEAIRRSLEDFTPKKSTITSTEIKISKISEEKINEGMGGGFPFALSNPEKDSIEPLGLLRENDPLQRQISLQEDGHENLDQIGEKNALQINDSLPKQSDLRTNFSIETDDKESLIDKLGERDLVSSLKISSETLSDSKSIYREAPHTNLVPGERAAPNIITDQFLDAFEGSGGTAGFKGVGGTSEVSSHLSSAMMHDACDGMLVGDHQKESEVVSTCHLDETAANANTNEVKPVARSDDLEQNVAVEKFLEPTVENSMIHDNLEVHMEVDGVSLDEEMLILRDELINLGEEQKKLERNAASVSSEMFAECQELLQMFGLPYVIAPMEAEAQCAHMELSGLVDGVVTDDSDVFLFGARSVYKNIFDDRKYVETYFMKDIETELGLTRDQLIRMALLLGSDYTEGISGIGIVNAIEVAHAFPEEDGLQQFREWLESPDPTILGNLNTQSGSNLKKRGSKISSNEVESGVDRRNSMDNIPKLKQIFMDKHRTVSKNWHIPASFPSETVISAYVSPQVDKSTEPFSWGKPDLFVLRKLCWEKLGWNNQKADDLLVPVLKEYNKHETQLRLEAFYTFNERFAKIRSKRIKKAVKGISGNRSSELIEELLPESPDASNSVPGTKTKTAEKSNSKKSRKRNEIEPMPSVVENFDTPIPIVSRDSTKKGSTGNARGRGRGRGRERGRGKGRGKEVHVSESSDTSISNEDDEVEMRVEIAEKSSEVRRSKRPRKGMIYTGNDVEAEDLSDSLNLERVRTDKDGTVNQEVSRNKGMFDKDISYDLKEVESSFIEDDGDLSRDRLGMGGGFCTEEDDPDPENELIMNRAIDSGLGSNIPFVEDASSKDYLKMGGGFCMDEDEKETSKPISSPTIDVPDEDRGMRKLDTCVNTNNDKDDGKETNVVSIPSMEEAVTTDQESASTGLKAMPFLKRKRKKI
ncbi:hypothetical protein MKW98_022731 [Papaver atlanticum]|uniref:DNA repair protein UVH3 n=1 Tax=Papaver atlanticum TaxID=357466 RepID=A0AAD4XYL3_9MAGN|nr:hypothetical protein MKW98_022731 [Papaver atlanticum]